MNPKKSIILTLLLVAILALPMLCEPVRAWKPDQHVGMGNIILQDLLYDSPGKVTINGVEYEASPLVYHSIDTYPEYYKFGCIGPDAYPDMIFGQVAIHPGKGTEESSDADVYSYEWFDHMLAQAVAACDWDLYRKAIAFTYGFMSHAAGDMFCHTFINRYAGGVWSLPTNGLRHMVAEGYVDELTGWKNTPVINEAEFADFSVDTVFRNWIYNTLIEHSWARAHTDGQWENFYDLFFGLKDSINSWLKEWNKDVWDRKWWAWPPHGWAVKAYLEAWLEDIDDGLRTWVDVSTQVAYALFINGDTDSAKQLLKDWFILHFLSMIGLPDIVGEVIDFLGDLASWISKMLSSIPVIKTIWQFFKGLWDTMKEGIVDWAFKNAFGVTLTELKDYLQNPAAYLDSPLFGTTPDASAAPFHPYTKEAIDEELAFALRSGSFDPEAFDATYDTIVMNKLSLLDGAGLNKLLKDNGIQPFYTEELGQNYESLAYSGMCVMRGFMKSLDADHQWMQVAPNGGEYGTGTPIWDNENAREWVFKKIFHVGSQVWLTPYHQAIHTGETASIEVTIVNTGNREDTIDICTLVEGNGTFTNANDPSGPILPSSVNLGPDESISYLLHYIYDEQEEVTGGRITVTVTPEMAPARTGDNHEVLCNHESAAVIVFKGQIEYLWLTIGEPKAITYRPDPRSLPRFAPRPPFNPVIPVSRQYAQMWPRSPFEEITHVTRNTPLYVYGYSKTTEITSFSCYFVNYTGGIPANLPYWQVPGDLPNGGPWDLEPKDETYVWRTKNPVWLSENCLFGSYLPRISDGYYEAHYASHDLADVTREATEIIILDNTPPVTTLAVDNFNDEMLPSPFVQYFPNTTFALDATDELSEVKGTYYGVTDAFGRLVAWWSGGKLYGTIVYRQIVPWTLYTKPLNLTLPTGLYALWYKSIDNLGNTDYSWRALRERFYWDVTPPSTNLTIGEPRYHVEGMKAQAYITSKTPLSLSAADINATGASVHELVARSSYRIRNETYDSGWQTYVEPFKLEGYSDGYYAIDYNSTDVAGNIELTSTTELILDNTQLEPVVDEISSLKEYVNSLHEKEDIDEYKHTRIISDLSRTETDITNAISYLDLIRHGFNDKVEGIYSIKSAISRLEFLIKDLRNWKQWNKISSELADQIAQQLTEINTVMASKAKSETEQEKTLAVAAIEDAQARGRNVAWLWNDISCIDQYLAQAGDCMAKGWLSRAVDYYKTAFSYSQYVVKKAYHWSYGVSQEDWIDQLEQNQ